jgi:hypothetical protein
MIREKQELEGRLTEYEETGDGAMAGDGQRSKTSFH